MKRRAFVAASLAGLGAGGAALLWARTDSGNPVDIDAALQKIDALAQGSLVATGTWNAHQIFTHCTQSIAYSMTGYPVAKPQLFQDTVGTAAFAVFSSKRKMMHGLSEPIPGAPAIDPNPEFQAALTQLRQAFVEFQKYDGTLAPHFAYGKLSKQEYAQAHVLHFWNHLDEIQTATHA